MQSACVCVGGCASVRAAVVCSCSCGFIARTLAQTHAQRPKRPTTNRASDRTVHPPVMPLLCTMPTQFGEKTAN